MLIMLGLQPPDRDWAGHQRQLPIAGQARNEQAPRPWRDSRTRTLRHLSGLLDTKNITAGFERRLGGIVAVLVFLKHPHTGSSRLPQRRYQRQTVARHYKDHM